MIIVLVRAFLLYVLIVFAIRLMGKRQLGELQPSELVVTILVSNIATLPIEDPTIPMFMGIVPILTIVCLDVIMSNVTLKSKTMRRIVSGNPKIIIRDGIIDQCEMRNLRFSIDDLMESLREQGIFDVRDVQFAIVETNGKINVYQKYQARTVTAEMLNMYEKSTNPPAVIVSDGAIINEGLQLCMLTNEWVNFILEQHKLTLQDVFLLTADSNADYLLVPKHKSGKGAP